MYTKKTLENASRVRRHLTKVATIRRLPPTSLPRHRTLVVLAQALSAQPQTIGVALHLVNSLRAARFDAPESVAAALEIRCPSLG